MLIRTLFSGGGPASTTVTVEDVRVGPRSTQQLAALPGPAVLEWLEGYGTVAVGSEAARKLSAGFQTITAGQTLTFSNPNLPPIGVRLYIFEGK